MSVGIRVPAPSFGRIARSKPRRTVPSVRPYITVRRHPYRYDVWVGPVVILGVLLFCLVMGLAGLNLIQHALTNR